MPTARPTPRPTARPTPRPTPTRGPIATPSPTASSCEPAPLIYHGSRTTKVVALTIDDGFSSAAALADLAILQERRVNATWLPIGRVVAADPGTWQRIAAAGYPFANHTWDHARLTLLDAAAVEADIRRGSEEVARIIGQPLLPFVRPFGGAWNQTVLCAARSAGERAVVLWDTSFGDAGSGDVDDLIANAEQGRNGSIILLHANGSLSQQALPAVIDFYRANGFEFVTLGQLLGVAGPVPFP